MTLAGVVDVTSVVMTPDGASNAYSYGQILSDLLVVEGVRWKSVIVDW